jgi:gliding motility-associated-like protein
MSKIQSIKTLLFCLAFLAMGFSVSAQKEEKPETVYKGCQVFVPNAFTPNGDQLNDQFTIKYNLDCEVKEYSLSVFDRWGHLVFQTNSFEEEQAWDGTNHGKKLNPGVYLWRLSMKMVNPNGNGEAIVVNKQGSVVLIR